MPFVERSTRKKLERLAKRLRAVSDPANPIVEMLLGGFAKAMEQNFVSDEILLQLRAAPAPMHLELPEGRYVLSVTEGRTRTAIELSANGVAIRKPWR
jgi:hypothetical protein